MTQDRIYRRIYTSQYVTPTQHEKNEWSRMAQAAYRNDHNDAGHRFSAAASIPHGWQMPLDRWDALMADYRRWLCFNEY